MKVKRVIYDYPVYKGSKPVIQYNLKNEYIQKFPSIIYAARVYKISSNQISKCCRGLRKSYDNSIWKFDNKEEITLNNFFIPFGKYKGQRLIKIKDQDYLFWLIKQEYLLDPFKSFLEDHIINTWEYIIY